MVELQQRILTSLSNPRAGWERFGARLALGRSREQTTGEEEEASSHVTQANCRGESAPFKGERAESGRQGRANQTPRSPVPLCP